MSDGAKKKRVLSYMTFVFNYYKILIVYLFAHVLIYIVPIYT